MNKPSKEIMKNIQVSGLVKNRGEKITFNVISARSKILESKSQTQKISQEEK